MLAGLTRSLTLLLASGQFAAAREVRAQMNAVTRTAIIAAQGLTMAAHDAIAGAREPVSLPPPGDLWSPHKVDELLRQGGANPASLATSLEAEVRALVDLATQRTLAARAASGGRDPVTGYRRVIHPELGKGGTCGLCVVASTRLYRRPDLRPIHERCHCGVTEVRAGYDPGAALNNLELGEIYEAANLADRSGSARSPLSNIRISRGEGSELVITKFRTAPAGPETAPPAGISASTNESLKSFLATLNATYAKQAG